MAKKIRRHYDEEYINREIEIASATCEALQNRGINPSAYLHKRLYSSKPDSPGLLPLKKYQEALKEISKKLGVKYNPESDTLPGTFKGLLSHLRRKVQNSRRSYQQIGILTLSLLEKNTDPDNNLQNDSPQKNSRRSPCP